MCLVVENAIEVDEISEYDSGRDELDHIRHFFELDIGVEFVVGLVDEVLCVKDNKETQGA